MDNRRYTIYLLLLWIPVTVFVILVLVGVLSSAQRGDFLPFAAVAVTIVVIGWLILRTRTRVNTLLQSDSPKPLIKFHDGNVGRLPLLPEKEADLAASRSLIYTLYGQFEDAKKEMGGIRWDDKPPLYQAQNVWLQALWAYLEIHDFQRGLNLAREARRLADVAPRFPGARTSIDTFDTAVEVGELLSGQPGVGAEDHLISRLRRLPVLVRVVAIWGLEGFYKRSGQIQEAQQMRNMLNKLAPHCAGLVIL